MPGASLYRTSSPTSPSGTSLSSASTMRQVMPVRARPQLPHTVLSTAERMGTDASVMLKAEKY